MLTICVVFAMLMLFCACQKRDARIMDEQTWEQLFSAGISEVPDAAQNRASYLENNVIVTDGGVFRSKNHNGVQGLYYFSENGQAVLLKEGYFANLQMQGEYLYAIGLGANIYDKPIMVRFNLRDNSMCSFEKNIQYGYVFSDGHMLYVYNEMIYYGDWENQDVKLLFEDASYMKILGQDDLVLLVETSQGNAFLFSQAEGMKTLWTINSDCRFFDLRDGVVYLGKWERHQFLLTAITVDGTVILNDEPVSVGDDYSKKYGFRYYLLTLMQTRALRSSSCKIVHDYCLPNKMHLICVDTNDGNTHCYIYLYGDRIYYNGSSYPLDAAS